MGYNAIGYLAVFLPAVILIYSLVPQKKRWIVVLAANYLFFYLLSGFLLLYNVAATLFTYYMGKLLGAKKPEGADKKAFKKKKNKILLAAILVNFGVLIVLKYTNFFGSSIAGIINHFGGDVRYRAIRFLVPIGISYYTMQAVSYLIDVNRGTLKVENNLAQLALYLSYFPTIMEGSITRYKDVAEDIYAGHPVTYETLTAGYQRIVWGLFKKVIIADILVKPVIKIFEGFQYDGAVCLYGAAICTLQLYMDFAGTIDIVIGTGKIFNVTIAENFRQPFFAKNASEFWRRWHITLGTWFKDYIFYPISVAKPIRNLTKKAQKRNAEYVGKLTDEDVKRSFGKRELNKLAAGKTTIAELRKARIAKGSGTDAARVNAVLKQYEGMKEMFKKVGDFAKKQNNGGTVGSNYTPPKDKNKKKKKR